MLGDVLTFFSLSILQFLFCSLSFNWRWKSSLQHLYVSRLIWTNEVRSFLCLFIFEEHFLTYWHHSEFRFDLDSLIRFILTVRKNYRRVPYHNWTHGFTVANCVYCILRQTKNTFKPLEVSKSHLKVNQTAFSILLCHVSFVIWLFLLFVSFPFSFFF